MASADVKSAAERPAASGREKDANEGRDAPASPSRRGVGNDRPPRSVSARAVFINPWTIALLPGLLILAHYKMPSLIDDPEDWPWLFDALTSQTAALSAIILATISGRVWRRRARVPAIFMSLWFIIGLRIEGQAVAAANVLMIPAILMAWRFGADPGWARLLAVYRRISWLDGLLLLLLLLTSAVALTTFAGPTNGQAISGPFLIAGAATVPACVLMLMFAISGVDRRPIVLIILVAFAAFLIGLVASTAEPLFPFAGYLLGLAPQTVLLCLTALYIEKVVPVLTRWSFWAVVRSVLALSLSVFLSSIAYNAFDSVAENETTFPLSGVAGWAGGWADIYSQLVHPLQILLIAIAIGIAAAFRRATKIKPKPPGGWINATSGIALMAGLAAYLNMGVDDIVLIGLTDFSGPILGAPRESDGLAVLSLEPLYLIGVLAQSAAFGLVGYFTARNIAASAESAHLFATWRTDQQGVAHLERHKPPRRLLMTAALGRVWVWSGPVTFGLAFAMILGGELARQEIAFDPRIAVRENLRTEPFTDDEAARLNGAISDLISDGSVSLVRDAERLTVRIADDAPGLLGPLSASNRVSAELRGVLRRISPSLSEIPGPIIVTVHDGVEGARASFFGPEKPSLARAKRIAAILAKDNITQERIGAVGAGVSDPIADSATAEGAAVNRRIEISIIGPSTPLEPNDTLTERLAPYQTCGQFAVRTVDGSERVTGAVATEEDLAALTNAVEADRAQGAQVALAVRVMSPGICLVRDRLSGFVSPSLGIQLTHPESGEINLNGVLGVGELMQTAAVVSDTTVGFVDLYLVRAEGAVIKLTREAADLSQAEKQDSGNLLVTGPRLAWDGVGYDLFVAIQTAEPLFDNSFSSGPDAEQFVLAIKNAVDSGAAGAVTAATRVIASRGDSDQAPPQSKAPSFKDAFTAPFTAVSGLIVRHGDIIDAVTPIFDEVSTEGAFVERSLGRQFGGNGGGEENLELPGYLIHSVRIVRGVYFGRSLVVHVQVAWRRLVNGELDPNTEIVSDRLGSGNFAERLSDPILFEAPKGQYIAGISSTSPGGPYLRDLSVEFKMLPVR